MSICGLLLVNRIEKNAMRIVKIFVILAAIDIEPPDTFVVEAHINSASWCLQIQMLFLGMSNFRSSALGENLGKL